MGAFIFGWALEISTLTLAEHVWVTSSDWSLSVSWRKILFRKLRYNSGTVSESLLIRKSGKGLSLSKKEIFTPMIEAQSRAVSIPFRPNSSAKADNPQGFWYSDLCYRSFRKYQFNWFPYELSEHKGLWKKRVGSLRGALLHAPTAMESNPSSCKFLSRVRFHSPFLRAFSSLYRDEVITFRS